MSKPLVNNELWAIVAPLLPLEPPKPRGGRPRRISDRAALTGMLFVLKSGIPWEMLPQEMGFGEQRPPRENGNGRPGPPHTVPAILGT